MEVKTQASGEDGFFFITLQILKEVLFPLPKERKRSIFLHSIKLGTENRLFLAYSLGTV